MDSILTGSELAFEVFCDIQGSFTNVLDERTLRLICGPA